MIFYRVVKISLAHEDGPTLSIIEVGLDMIFQDHLKLRLISTIHINIRPLRLDWGGAGVYHGPELFV